MQVSQVDLASRRQVRAFVELPFALYHHCPQWVPPLVGDVYRALDPRRHPFYQHSAAAYFLAEDNGRLVGRIAAMDNRRHNEYRGSHTALFGFFECCEDGAVARALFDAAVAWARARGLRDMLGPKGLLRADGMGILVEGHAHRPAVGIPYNLPYYGRLIEDIGFAKEIDYHSGLLRAEYRLPARILELAERVKERRGFRILTFRTKNELRAWAPAIRQVYNQAFAQVWGFYPMGKEDLQATVRGLMAIADPRLVKLVLKDEAVVGFLLAYPDISAGLQAARGRLWPLGWWHILRAQCRTRWINVNGLGLLPEYQGLGANAVLYAELQASILARGADYADLAQVAETNAQSMGEMKALGVEWYKRHRIYRREL
ncbi:MAG: hypothetical protein V1772_03315 [Chloroflexota bacterium]